MTAKKTKKRAKKVVKAWGGYTDGKLDWRLIRIKRLHRAVGNLQNAARGKEAIRRRSPSNDHRGLAPMTHPSPTALEEKNAIAATDRDAAHVRTDHAVPSVVLAAVKACAASWVPDARLLGNVRAGDIVRAIAALEAEHSRMREALEDIESSHLPDQPAESSYDERGWAMMWIGRLRGVAKVALEVSSSRAEKAEAQLATRLPDKDVLAKRIKGKLKEFLDKPVTIDEGAAGLAELVAGAATPAPTAALTEEELLTPELIKKAADAGERVGWDDVLTPNAQIYHRAIDLKKYETALRAVLPIIIDRLAKSPPQGAEE